MRIVIIGAGPCGLGAAWRLSESGHDAWEVFEAEPHAGGLAASFLDDRGFTWDVGGHVLFTKYDVFRNVVAETLAGDVVEHLRSAWIRTQDRWIPYPYQENLHYLAESDREACLAGLDHRPTAPPSNFREWILASFGEGIADRFMLPYNEKVWGTRPDEMDYHWIAERVRVIDPQKVAELRKGDAPKSGWGPNSTFIFPKIGGTGEIYRRIAARFADRIHYGKKVTAVDPSEKAITFSDGTRTRYDRLITSMRLDHLLAAIPGAPAAPALRPVGGAVVGIGVETHEESDRCWVYFPELPPCFYRLTYFHRYSSMNVPGGDVGRYSAFMCETVVPPGKNISREDMIAQTVAGLVHAGIMTAEDRKRIVSTWHIPVPAIYPVPSLGLRADLARIQPRLDEMGIYSRGRFGGWRYEVGNMDHSFMQGWEAVGRILCGENEPTWNSK